MKRVGKNAIFYYFAVLLGNKEEKMGGNPQSPPNPPVGQPMFAAEILCVL